MNTLVECSDFLKFQDALKTMREIDDKIVYALNSIIPTESFKSQVDPASTCKDLYGKLESGHEYRTHALSNCITLTAQKLKTLKEQQNDDNFVLGKQLKEEQTKLRSLQTELSVEEVIKQRSDKVFHEKCRKYYTPEKLA